MALHIDFISDVTCPWCFISKRQLEGALRSVAGPSTIKWHPMQRYPDLPAAGEEKAAFLKSRFGDPAGVRRGIEALVKSGSDVGIGFDFENIDRMPNTLSAHRLIYACPANLQNGLVENLFSAFFEKAQDISDRDLLLELAASSGFDPEEALKALEADATRDAVLSEQTRLRQMGLSGIPNILLNKHLAVSGAHNSDSLLRAFDYAVFGLPEKNQAPPVLH